MLRLGTILLLAALFPLGSTIGAKNNLRSSSSSCDESFPLAPPPRVVQLPNGERRILERLQDHVAIPPGDVASAEYYETGHYYAPLCDDGKRLDIRRLKNCINEQCFDEEIGHCTYVCTWTAPSPPPTPAPTKKPTYPQEITEHPLLMDLSNLPKRYRMSKEVRASILRYIRDKLKLELDDLGMDIELVEVSYPGRLPGRPHALPLTVTMKGPSDISDFALSYIMQAMGDAGADIDRVMSRELDWKKGYFVNLDEGSETDADAFASEFKDLDLRVSFETFNFKEIEVGETAVPTSPPTPAPTPDPNQQSSVQSNKSKKVVVMDAEDTTTTTVPWWVWLIVVLVLLCCCLGCCCYCRRRRNRGDDDKGTTGKGTNVNLFVTGTRAKRKKPRPVEKSVASSSKRSRRPEHQHHNRPPRSVGMSRRGGSIRTMRTHRTKQTRQSRRPQGFEYGDPPKQIPPPTFRPPIEFGGDVESAISALPMSEDPPEEQHALVVYKPRDPTRDPTSYTDHRVITDQAEPEGDKVFRKQSVFATGAMMNEVHRERERKEEEAKRERASRRNHRDVVPDDTDDGVDPVEEGYGGQEYSGGRDPTYYLEDGGGGFENSDRILSEEPEGVTSDEVQRKKKKKKRKKGKKEHNGGKSGESKQSHRSERSKRSYHEQRRPSMGNRLKASLSWRRGEQHPPIDNEMDESVSDSPSMATNHEEGRNGELPPAEDNPYYRDGTDPGASHSHAPSQPSRRTGGHSNTQTRTTSRMEGNNASRRSAESRKKKPGMFSVIKRRSLRFERDGVSSDDSFHLENEGENVGRTEQRRDSYSSDSSASC